ncbi:hypothetical protein GCM10008967_11220 [Bacillus carboniphilus]|uniref:Uncharacterized protein n=1 Tax=Bacillus carboniphilus TaxID=86663 RepID=A0ABN0W168_9BACI
MAQTILISLSIILILFFVIVPKHLHVFEWLIVILTIEFIFTSYTSILHMNVKVWEISPSTFDFLAFRVFETVTVPVLYLIVMNWVSFLSNWMKRTGIMLMGAVLLVLLEWTLVKSNVITYVNWSMWVSFLFFSLYFPILVLIMKGYHHILQREGIVKR